MPGCAWCYKEDQSKFKIILKIVLINFSEVAWFLIVKLLKQDSKLLSTKFHCL